MTRITLILVLLTLSFSAAAQQPPTETPAQQEVKKQWQAVEEHRMNLYNKLRDLAEFTDYLAAEREEMQLQQKYRAAGKPETSQPAKAEKGPAK